jgi:RsiW-degrading membrane proteinase PrsW (M82 family)
MASPEVAGRDVQERLETAVAEAIERRRSKRLAFVDARGRHHAFVFRDGLDVEIRSSLVTDEPRAGEAGDLAEEIFALAREAEALTTGAPPDEARAEGRAVAIDAFELLLRGVRARSRDPGFATRFQDVAPICLHGRAALEVFPLGPAELKVAKRIESLPRSFDDLVSSRLLAEPELAAFLHFLLLTHNAFFLDAEPNHAVPLGRLTFAERERRAAAAAPEPDRRRLAVGGYGYALFGGALLPLALLLVSGSDVQTRIARTLQAHPEIRPLISRGAAEDEVFRALPGGKIEGALLSLGSHAHWLFALASAAIFLALLFGTVDRGRATRRDLVRVLLFTGIVGTVLLFGIQLVASATRGTIVRGYGWGAIIFYVVKLIGFSYDAAADPGNGLFLSFFGFTCGVGFCEEAVKALPLLDHFRTKSTLDVRGALAWGLASGVGLGVVEGVIYAGGQYNGVASPLLYVVRFVSCVALHATWTASVAMAIYARRRELQVAGNVLDRFITLLTVITIPMVLHGLYDTLLKKSFDLGALGVAIASFGYFVFRVSKIPRPAPAEESAPVAA